MQSHSGNSSENSDYGDFTNQEEDTQTFDLCAQAKEHPVTARNLCAQYPGQTRALGATELDDVERMLCSSTFYSPVTPQEMRDVVSAMAREFSGTGHWYRCVNGHPFTIGECGGAVM